MTPSDPPHLAKLTGLSVMYMQGRFWHYVAKVSLHLRWAGGIRFATKRLRWLAEPCAHGWSNRPSRERWGWRAVEEGRLIAAGRIQ